MRYGGLLTTPFTYSSVYTTIATTIVNLEEQAEEQAEDDFESTNKGNQNYLVLTTFELQTKNVKNLANAFTV